MMKIRTIINAFQPLSAVFDSIEGLQRKWSLIPAFKELKEAAEMYDKEREELLLKHTLQDGTLNNAAFYQDHLKTLETEIEIQRPFIVTKEEVDHSKIKNSEIVKILDFMFDK